MASSHSWEQRHRSFEARPTSSHRFEGVWADSDDESEGDGSDATGPEAGEQLVDLLLSLHYAGQMSAKTLSLICWWSAKAGAAGPVQKYGFRPDAPTGHYQRHLDQVSGVSLKAERSWRYVLSVPSLAKYDPSRCCHDVPVNVPHECLSEEILEHPEILDEVEATQWPPAYYDNPIVRRDGRRVVPLALYLDGVPSTKRDGILGFWVYNLLTRRRHLICVLRKSSLCKCGCGGWDSIYVVWRFLLWSLRAMSSGTFPNQRHDQLAWTDADAQRASLAGTPLGFTAMLLQIKGDWLEFCTTAGFVTWSHKQFPCMFCGAALDQIANFIGFGPFSPTYPLMKHADYEAACCACELTKHLTKEQWRLVKNCLAYDKTKKGSRGRALIRDLPSVGLQQGDRLEPDSTFQDVASFDNVESWPVRVTVWRRAVETRVKRRLPILQPDLGITLDTFCIDVLHCLYLGPVKDWCCAVLWAMVDYNVFGVAHANVDTRLPLTVLRIRELLWDFYNRWQGAHPGEDISRLEDLTPGMIGSSAHRNLATKAMETKWRLQFAAGRRVARGRYCGVQ